jgi:hypothetical protein
MLHLVEVSSVRMKGKDHCGELSIKPNYNVRLQVCYGCSLKFRHLYINPCTAVSLNSQCYKIRKYLGIVFPLTFKGYWLDYVNSSLRKVR